MPARAILALTALVTGPNSTRLRLLHIYASYLCY